MVRKRFYRFYLTDVKTQRETALFSVGVSIINIRKILHLPGNGEGAYEFQTEAVVTPHDTENVAEFVQLVVVILIVNLDRKTLVDLSRMRNGPVAFICIDKIVPKLSRHERTSGIEMTVSSRALPVFRQDIFEPANEQTGGVVINRSKNNLKQRNQVPLPLFS